MSFQELSTQEKQLLHGLFLRTRNKQKKTSYQDLIQDIAKGVDGNIMCAVINSLVEKQYINITGRRHKAVSLTEKAEEVFSTCSFICAYWEELLDEYEHWLAELEYVFDEHIITCSSCSLLFQNRDPYNSMLKAVVRNISDKKKNQKK